jgi:hypothetical protein
MTELCSAGTSSCTACFPGTYSNSTGVCCPFVLPLWCDGRWSRVCAHGRESSNVCMWVTVCICAQTCLWISSVMTIRTKLDSCISWQANRHAQHAFLGHTATPLVRVNFFVLMRSTLSSLLLASVCVCMCCCKCLGFIVCVHFGMHVFADVGINQAII